MKEEVLISPIRWAGSKKKLLNEMLNSFKKKKKNYVEPFLGSGVVLLNVLNNSEFLKYENYYVNDINENIINFFKLLQSEVNYLEIEIEKILKKYNSLNDLKLKEDYYYSVRNKYNNTNKKIKAVYFYFLMKAGFNGVYRENSKGMFNVPFGKKEKLILQKGYLELLSEKLKNVHFYNLDYNGFFKIMSSEKILEQSFIYCDPPYLSENQNPFLYTKTNFEHEQFISIMERINKASIFISMSCSEKADKIYGNKFAKYKLIDIIRIVNPKKRIQSTEVAFTNYQLH